ncbi:hypothetical protein F511_46818 [Dorcoceras hygrometricum]|uniref:Uncharacterized protein n=1 Tax=Dorcoceras hygrometricum TaxID=472368 RepID=A0A2Z6ZSH8_9LAMI|nr:hypothetical protein F511_46818 [Dorcoceras hygrometricum]
MVPCWRLGAWLRPISRGNLHFNGWRFWPPNPVYDRSALENSMKISRTEYPHRNGQNEIFDDGGGRRRRAETAAAGEEWIGEKNIS